MSVNFDKERQVRVVDLDFLRLFPIAALIVVAQLILVSELIQEI